MTPRNFTFYRMLLFGFTCALVLPAQNNPISSDARQSYALVKDSLLKAADRMPAQDYSFRTVPQVRTFGEMIAHVADAPSALRTSCWADLSLIAPISKRIPARMAKYEMSNMIAASVAGW